jgi:prepilin signal peptidase PulO-like enzyme (type II secretory pathway)
MVDLSNIMIAFILFLYGVVFGSFVNALVWRVYQQAEEAGKKRPNQKRLKTLSISQGRSMCTDCGHELAAKDLVPLLSWLWLRGKCRYCRKPISVQYPAVELVTGLLFAASYIWWPKALSGLEIGVFAAWLVLLVGFMALLVYDLRWMLLPNRLVYPLTGVALAQALLTIAAAGNTFHATLNTLAAVLVGSGIFYVLFQISGGKWIGGGDVKLGWVIGLSLGTAASSALCIFLASLLGSLVSIPLLATRQFKQGRVLPFGPFLIVGTIIAQLFGVSLFEWYKRQLLGL